MICKNCNKMIPDGRNYCPFCGSMTIQSSDSNENKDNSNVSGNKIESDFLKSETGKTEPTPNEIDNPGKIQRSKIETRYVVIISVLATLLCCALLFIIYQSTTGRAPVNDGNTVAEDLVTQSDDREVVKEQENDTESQPEETLVSSETVGENTVNDTKDPDESHTEKDQAKSGLSIDISTIEIPRNYFVYGEHGYGIYDATRFGLTSYEEVKKFCRDQGGYLAVINDIYENDELFSFVSNNSAVTAFFGYSDEKNESEWKWANGHSSFTNWTYTENERQPDNGSGYDGDEDYAEFNYERNTNSANDGTWNDAPFMSNTSFFICEWDCDLKLY